MSPEEYWHGDVELMGAYRKAYRIIREERNYDMWLQGYYFYSALTAVVHNALSKTGDKPLEYPKEPFRIFPMTEAEKKAEKEKATQEFIDKMNAIADKIEQRNNG